MKLFMACLVTETNSFSPLPTGMLSFEEGGLFHGDGTAQPLHYWSAPLHVWKEMAAARGIALAEGLTAVAQPAGPTLRQTYEALRDEILDNLRTALPVDMVLLALHGGMIAEGHEDCEGELIARIRDIVGAGVVIGGLLDPHAHLTARMMTEATLLVPFKEYPHVDAPDRARDLFTLALDAAQGRIRPVMRDHDCRIICALHTPHPPMRGFVERMSAREGQDGVLHVGLIHGFPWGDHPRTGARSLVITDGDPDRAAALAREVAADLWAIRDGLDRPHPTIDQALDRALASPARPVVLADVADNAGGGAPGDATFLLRAIRARGLRDAVVGIFWDPMAMRPARARRWICVWAANAGRCRAIRWICGSRSGGSPAG